MHIHYCVLSPCSPPPPPNPRADSSNSRLGKTCALRPVPAIAEQACKAVNKGEYFKPSTATVAVHMWTHVFLGWSILRGAINAATYTRVEKALPPTMQCAPPDPQ